MPNRKVRWSQLLLPLRPSRIIRIIPNLFPRKITRPPLRSSVQTETYHAGGVRPRTVCMQAPIERGPNKPLGSLPLGPTPPVVSCAGDRLPKRETRCWQQALQQRCVPNRVRKADPVWLEGRCDYTGGRLVRRAPFEQRLQRCLV